MTHTSNDEHMNEDAFGVDEMSGLSNRKGILVAVLVAGGVAAVVAATALVTTQDDYAVNFPELVGAERSQVEDVVGQPIECEALDSSGKGQLCRYDLDGNEKADLTVGFQVDGKSALVKLWVPEAEIDAELFSRLELNVEQEPESVVGSFYRWVDLSGIPEVTMKPVEDTVLVSGNTINFGPDFREYRWRTSKADILEREDELLEEQSAAEVDMLHSGEILVYKGELGGSPAEVSYIFNGEEELCGGMYGVFKYNPKLLIRAMNGDEDVDPDKVDTGVDVEQVRSSVKEALIDKYGGTYSVQDAGNTYQWRKHDKLILMRSDIGYVKVLYLYPECAKGILATKISESLFPSETVGADL